MRLSFSNLVMETCHQVLANAFSSRSLFFFFSELTRYSRNEISPGAISHMKETPLCEKRGSELLMIQRAFNDRSRRCTLCGLVEKERKGTGNTCIVQGSRN